MCSIYYRIMSIKWGAFTCMAHFASLTPEQADAVLSHPSMPTKELAAFCQMKGFDCALHDLRHTFAAMLIGGGNARFAHYVRTVASYLGHSSVSITLSTYADVGPEAKIAAVGKNRCGARQPLSHSLERRTTPKAMCRRHAAGITMRCR
ncbi:MAG TPA: hypothetical protein DCP91_04960 [Eggerthellaceae bacterium]|nr:hypothetical protein [Eggerthellaceae bacterium]